jgi:guanylate kinase
MVVAVGFQRHRQRVDLNDFLDSASDQDCADFRPECDQCESIKRHVTSEYSTGPVNAADLSHLASKGNLMCTTNIPDAWPYDELLPPRRGLLVVFSGPSGTGKDAVLGALGATGVPFTRIVTVTTRPPRPAEVAGVDYRFVTVDEFAQLRDADHLLEWAEVYGRLYGTPLDAVREALDRDETVILKIDVQGAASVKRRAPNAVFIFLGPGSFDELVGRLAGRGTESSEAFQLRVLQAREELRQLPEYDYLVINRQGELDCAVEHVRAIITAERLKVHPRDIRLG